MMNMKLIATDLTGKMYYKRFGINMLLFLLLSLPAFYLYYHTIHSALLALIPTLLFAGPVCYALQRSICIPVSVCFQEASLAIDYYLLVKRTRTIPLSRVNAVCYKYGKKKQYLSISTNNTIIPFIFSVNDGWTLDKQDLFLTELRNNRIRTHYKDRYPEHDF